VLLLLLCCKEKARTVYSGCKRECRIIAGGHSGKEQVQRRVAVAQIGQVECAGVGGQQRRRHVAAAAAPQGGLVEGRPAGHRTLVRGQIRPRRAQLHDPLAVPAVLQDVAARERLADPVRQQTVVGIVFVLHQHVLNNNIIRLVHQFGWFVLLLPLLSSSKEGTGGSSSTMIRMVVVVVVRNGTGDRKTPSRHRCPIIVSSRCIPANNETSSSPLSVIVDNIAVVLLVVCSLHWFSFSLSLSSYKWR
jgi:hypothetical protein